LNIIVDEQSSEPLLDEQIQEFVAHVDAIAERLTPQRRPQDASEPECSLMELRALAILGRREPITMSELAGALKMPLSSVTHTVDKLVGKRLAERRRVKKDRRLVQVGFSKRGKEINQFVTEKRLAAARSMFEALKPPERAVVVKRLAKMAKGD
jgi:DNA-binding MarR family transcriptional regulator